MDNLKDKIWNEYAGSFLGTLEKITITGSGIVCVFNIRKKLFIESLSDKVAIDFDRADFYDEIKCTLPRRNIGYYDCTLNEIEKLAIEFVIANTISVKDLGAARKAKKDALTKEPTQKDK